MRSYLIRERQHHEHGPHDNLVFRAGFRVLGSGFEVVGVGLNATLAYSLARDAVMN